MKQKNIYPVTHFIIAIGMILSLAWLTVSTPFVYKAQQETAKQQALAVTDEEDASNPFANTTEEKTPNSLTALSEYLHEAATIQHPVQIISSCFPVHSSSLYIAFHGELLSPPPEV